MPVDLSGSGFAGILIFLEEIPLEISEKKFPSSFEKILELTIIWKIWAILVVIVLKCALVKSYVAKSATNQSLGRIKSCLTGFSLKPIIGTCAICA